MNGPARRDASGPRRAVGEVFDVGAAGDRRHRCAAAARPAPPTTRRAFCRHRPARRDRPRAGSAIPPKLCYRHREARSAVAIQGRATTVLRVVSWIASPSARNDEVMRPSAAFSPRAAVPAWPATSSHNTSISALLAIGFKRDVRHALCRRSPGGHRRAVGASRAGPYQRPAPWRDLSGRQRAGSRKHLAVDIRRVRRGQGQRERCRLVIQRRPHCSGLTVAALPEPQVGSRTKSPGSVTMSMTTGNYARSIGLHDINLQNQQTPPGSKFHSNWKLFYRESLLTGSGKSLEMAILRPFGWFETVISGKFWRSGREFAVFSSEFPASEQIPGVATPRRPAASAAAPSCTRRR